MAEIIRFPAQAASLEVTEKPRPASDTEHSDQAQTLVSANQCTLKATLALIDGISVALNRVEAIHKNLPDGPNKRLMQEQRARLSLALFGSRMLAISLSSDFAKLDPSSCESDMIYDEILRSAVPPR